MQESAPEQLELKRGLLADIDAATPAHVVVASSTSGFGMTRDGRSSARTPERLVVAHPFNPPYLIPLVEVVGGEKTAADVVAWTAAFFRHVGKSVITMDREVPGFIANRLQEALWREALHMVAAGEATVEQIDAVDHRRARACGGPFHGPDADLPPRRRARAAWRTCSTTSDRRCSSPWTRLAAPELTPELRDEVVARLRREEAGPRSIADLVRERDRGAHRPPARARQGT